MQKNKKDQSFVQYGCGFSNPKEWINYDNSPSILVQRIPVFGSLIKKILRTSFPDNIKYGDIIKGLPVQPDSCDAVYCSHTLEHLSLENCRKAIKNTRKILKEGGVFRCVVPDLEYCAREYIKNVDNGDLNASIKFVGEDTLLGIEKQKREGFRDFVISFMGVSFNHLWMWDYLSLSEELRKCGFKEIRRADFNDSEIKEFIFVEHPDRFKNAVAIECKK